MVYIMTKIKYNTQNKGSVKQVYIEVCLNNTKFSTLYEKERE